MPPKKPVKRTLYAATPRHGAKTAGKGRSVTGAGVSCQPCCPSSRTAHGLLEGRAPCQYDLHEQQGWQGNVEATNQVISLDTKVNSNESRVCWVQFLKCQVRTNRFTPDIRNAPKIKPGMHHPLSAPLSVKSNACVAQVMGLASSYNIQCC
jgi:hypothetical protein